MANKKLYVKVGLPTGTAPPTTTKVTNASNISYTHQMDSLGAASFNVPNNADEVIVSWEEKYGYYVEIWLDDTTDELVWAGYVRSLSSSPKFVTIKCFSHLDQYKRLKTFLRTSYIYNGDVVSASSSIVQVQSKAGVEPVWDDDSMNNYYLVITDSTIGENETTLKNSTNNYIGYDDGGYGYTSSVGDYTNVSKTTNGTYMEYKFLADDTESKVCYIDMEPDNANNNRITNNAIISEHTIQISGIIQTSGFILPETMEVEIWCGINEVTRSVIGSILVPLQFLETDHDFTLEIPTSDLMFGDGVTYKYGGFVGFKFQNYVAGTNCQINIKWDALACEVVWDTETFGSFNSKITDTLGGNELDTVDDAETVGVAGGDDFYIAMGAESYLTQLTHVLPYALPKIDIEINLTENRGIVVDNWASDCYSSLVNACDLLGLHFYENMTSTKSKLVISDFAEFPSGGELTGFNNNPNLRSEENIVTSVWIYGRGFSVIYPNIYPVGTNVVFLNKPQLKNSAEAYNFAKKYYDDHQELQRSYQLEFDQWVDLKVGETREITVNGVTYDGVGSNPSELAVRSFTIEQDGALGPFKIVAQLGGGHTPPEEKIGRYIGLLRREKEMEDKVDITIAYNELYPRYTDGEVIAVGSDYFLRRDGSNTMIGDFNLNGQAILNADWEGNEIGDLYIANDITLDNLTQITTRSHTVLSDIGTLTHDELESAITTHIEDTTTHGATGAVVGTTNTQTITNKTLTDPIIDTLHSSGSYVNVTDKIKARSNIVSGDTTGSYVLVSDDMDYPDGVASLDSGKELIFQQLPSSVIHGLNYAGIWDASSTVYPDDTDLPNGSMYVCIEGGTVGGTEYTFGDVIIWNLVKDRWDLKSRELGIYAAEFITTYDLEAADAQIVNCRVGGKYPHKTPYVLPFYEDDHDWLTTAPSYITSITSMTKAEVNDEYVDELKGVLECKGTSATGDANKILIEFDETQLTGQVDFTAWLSSADGNTRDEAIGVFINLDGSSYTFGVYLTSLSGSELQVSSDIDTAGGGGLTKTLDPSEPVFISIKWSGRAIDTMIEIFVNGEYFNEMPYPVIQMADYPVESIEIQCGNAVDAYICGLGCTAIESLYIPFSAKDRHLNGALLVRDVSINEILQTGDTFVSDDEHLLTTGKLDEWISDGVNVDANGDFKKSPTVLGNDWVVGSNPTGWNINNDVSCSSLVVASEDGHNNVIKLLNESISGNCDIDYDTLATNDISLLLKYVDGVGYVTFYETTTVIGKIEMGYTYATTDYISWYDGSTHELLTDIEEDTWYHVALKFNYVSDNVDIYINGIFNSTQSLNNNISSDISKIRLTVENYLHKLYVDSVSYENIFDNIADGVVVCKGLVVDGQTLAQNALAAVEAAKNYLENIVEDTTPQLGGNLDGNEKTIYNTKPYCFRAHRAAAQSIPDATYTDVIFNVEDYDPHSDYNTATGEYTVPADGYYTISTTVTFANVSWSNGEVAVLQLLLNGTVIAVFERLEVQATNTFFMLVNGVTDYYFAKDDVIKIQTYQNTGSALNTNNNSDYMHFSVHKIA